MKTFQIRFFIPLFFLLPQLFAALPQVGITADSGQKPKVVYNGKTGFGSWYACNKSKVILYEKDKKLIAYVNQSSFECFGIYFEPTDIHRMKYLEFDAGIETNYKEDTVELYVAIIDVSKNMSNFRKLKLRLLKGPVKTFRLALDDAIIRELKLDFSKINSILFYAESKKENGFWGNVVLKNIHLL